MKKDNTSGYATSLRKLITGIAKVHDIIAPTYGASGGNVLIEETAYPGHRVVNDGKIITDSILLKDPTEQMGVNLLREVCDKQEKDAGDGRKTTIILTTAILKEGLKHLKTLKPLEIKRELDSALPGIVESICNQTTEIPLENIGSIAKVASESDEIGSLIGEIYPKIGREGIIELESSGIPSTFYEIVDGVRLHGAKMYAGWQTEPDVCVIQNPKILICRDKIQNVAQIEPIYKKLMEAKIHEVVIYCEDMDMSVVSRIAFNTVKAFNGEPRVKTLVIKAPVMWKDWIYEDLSLMTGAIAIDAKEGRTFNTFETSQLGTCGTWRATKEDSRLNGTKDMQGHIESLKEKGIKNDQNLVRASWLNTKVAILKVGANSESELSWKLKKTKDACHASYYALKEGIVPGAGTSLITASKALPETIGGKILRKALQYPTTTLRENDGTETDFHDILDPSIVIRSAITNAVSLAGIILTTKGAITIPIEIKEKMERMSNRMTPQ